jgi:predicted esterase
MHIHPMLDNLYLGNINPNEDLKPAFSEYEKLNKEAAELESQVKDKLAEIDRDLFNMMLNARCSVSAMEVREAFIVGFRLGANITLETLGTYIPNEI